MSGSSSKSERQEARGEFVKGLEKYIRSIVREERELPKKPKVEVDESFTCCGNVETGEACPEGDDKQRAPAGTKVGKVIMATCKSCKYKIRKARKDARKETIKNE